MRERIKKLCLAGAADLDDLSGEYGRAFEAFGRSLQRFCGKLAEFSEKHQVLEEQAYALVPLVQFHDVLSQRNDHAALVLRHIAEKLSSEGFFPEVAALQIAQIRALKTETEEIQARAGEDVAALCEELRRMGEEAGEMEDLAGAMQTGLAFFPRLTERLEAAAARLEPLLEEPGEPLSPEKAREIARIYTTRGERGVHARFFSFPEEEEGEGPEGAVDLF